MWQMSDVFTKCAPAALAWAANARVADVALMTPAMRRSYWNYPCILFQLSMSWLAYRQACVEFGL